MIDFGRWKERTFEERPNEDIIFRFVYKTDEERDDVAAELHKRLRGKQSYVDSKIVLNIDEPKTIILVVDWRVDLPGWLAYEVACCRLLLN